MTLSAQLKTDITIDTARFGTLSVAEDKIISFVRPIPGFEKLRRYILLDHDAEGAFKWLQSVEEPEVAFLLTDPVLYKADYKVRLSGAETESLGPVEPKDLVFLVMVCVSREQRQISLNLKAPVVFNSAAMKAVQTIIDREDFVTDFVIKIT